MKWWTSERRGRAGSRPRPASSRPNTRCRPNIALQFPTACRSHSLATRKGSRPVRAIAASLAFFACAVGLFAASCRPGGVAQLAMPDSPSGSDVVDGRCAEVGEYPEPLVVDMSPADRSSLELAMRDGLAVVSYGCKGLRVLSRCKAEGAYQYFGGSPRDQVVQLSSADDLALSLPLSGIPLGVRLRGELSRGSSLTIGMVLVGKQTSTASDVAANSLIGECAGATHVVRGAHVGAFAMTTSASASVKGAVEVMTLAVAARSAKSKTVNTSDGDFGACKLARSDALGPPGNCSAPVRLELLAIGRAYSTETRVVSSRCPDGSWNAGGKCTSKPTQPHACLIADLPDCSTQCARGDANSCETLGYAYDRAVGVKRNATNAARFYKRACDSGSNGGCFYLALMHYNDATGLVQDHVRAAELNRIACQTIPEACTNLAALYERGHGVSKDWTEAVALQARACRGGHALACANLGNRFMEGTHVDKDEKFAAELFGRGCLASVPTACESLAEAYLSGRGVEKNEAMGLKLRNAACSLGDPMACYYLGRHATAVPLLERDCRFGMALACDVLAQAYRSGHGVAADRAMALRFSIIACDKDDYYCSDAGIAHMTGDGVPRDPLRARDFFRRACDAGSPHGCENLGMSYLQGGDGTPRDKARAIEALRRACASKLPSACRQLSDLGAN